MKVCLEVYRPLIVYAMQSIPNLSSCYVAAFAKIFATLLTGHSVAIRLDTGRTSMERGIITYPSPHFMHST